MKKHNTKTETRQILSSELHIDDYQRKLCGSRVNRIVQEFDPDLVNYIKCSRRKNGTLYIFDGQHTRAALERRNGNKPVMVQCRIYEFAGLTDSERYDLECKLFAKQNGIARDVPLGEKLIAEFKSKDPKATEFYNCSNIAGLVMDFTRAGGEGKIRCVREALRAWEMLGDDLYQDMLRIIVETWGLDEDGLRGEIIGGLAIFINAYRGRYDRKRLVKKLSVKKPVEIIRDGNSCSEQSKKKYARQIENVYSKGTKYQLYGI